METIAEKEKPKVPLGNPFFLRQVAYGLYELKCSECRSTNVKIVDKETAKCCDCGSEEIGCCSPQKKKV